MQQQHAVRVQLDQDVLSAAAEGTDLRAVEPLGERRRKRPTQIKPAQLRPHDPASADLQRRPRRTVSTSGSSGIAHAGKSGAGRRAVARATPSGLSSCPMSEDETSGGVAFRITPCTRRREASLVRAVFGSVAPRYDLMNDLMSGGTHRRWKTEMVAWLNPLPGQLLLDVAGGTGDIGLRAPPRLASPDAPTPGRVVVCDTSEQMLAIGRARALDQGV